MAIVAGAPSAWNETDPISRAIVDVIRELLGPERRAGPANYREPGLRHDDVLRRSPFSVVEHWQMPVRHERTVDQLIGLQLSTSHSTPALLGDRLDAFVTRLRERLLEIVPDGPFVETATLDAFCAYRP